MFNKSLKTIFIVPLLVFLLSNNLAYASNINTEPEKSALIINADEHSYGSFHCRLIQNILNKNGFTVTYLENQDVKLDFIKNSLAADIVYINTHGGYWDTDGDKKPDKIVIATGELWADQTEMKYSFDYENNLIFKCEISDKPYIAFTPEFIDYYYDSDDFSESIVYLATCHASYDDSMANSFLSSGASVYVGWNEYTVFWTNSMSSVVFFSLLEKNFSIRQICRIIGHGSFYNLLLRSKLTYFGNGNYKMR